MEKYMKYDEIKWKTKRKKMKEKKVDKLFVPLIE